VVLVTVGTQTQPFPRLLQLVESQIESGALTGPVLAQVGTTLFSSASMETVSYLPPIELEQRILECDLMISHGGAGMLMTGVKMGKRVIAVPRLKRYGEHVNDHQVEIVRHLADEGYLIDCTTGDLGACLQLATDFTPAPYHAEEDTPITAIEEFIDAVRPRRKRS